MSSRDVLQNWDSVFGKMDKKEKREIIPENSSRTYTRIVKDGDGDEIITTFTESDMFEKIIFISEAVEKLTKIIETRNERIELIEKKLDFLLSSHRKIEDTKSKDERNDPANISSDTSDSDTDLNSISSFVRASENDTEGKEGRGERGEGKGEKEGDEKEEEEKEEEEKEEKAKKEEEEKIERFTPYYNKAEYVFEDNYTELRGGKMDMNVMIAGDSDQILIYPFGNQKSPFECDELFHEFNVLDEDLNSLGVTYLKFAKKDGLDCLFSKDNVFEDNNGVEKKLTDIKRPFYFNAEKCPIK